MTDTANLLKANPEIRQFKTGKHRKRPLYVYSLNGVRTGGSDLAKLVDQLQRDKQAVKP